MLVGLILKNIRRRTTGGVLLLGYDINKAALDVARQKIGSSAIFIEQLSVSAIKNYKKTSKKK